MRRIGIGCLGLALLVWLAGLTGCGRQPAAPQLPMNSSSAVVAAAPAAEDPTLLGLSPNPIKLVPKIVGGGLELVQPVTGLLGTTMVVDDITLRIPPNAIDGDAQVQVTVPDTTKLECFLHITPADKNHFAQPVSLEFQLDRGVDPRVMTIFWFDEANGGWAAIPSTYDKSTNRIEAELQHFSIYKADTEVQGRAGW